MALETLKYGSFKPTWVANDAKALPGYGGEVQGWADYKFAVQAIEKREVGMPENEKKKLGPLSLRLVERLAGPALQVAKKIGLEKLSEPGGTTTLLDGLEAHLLPLQKQAALELYHAGKWRKGFFHDSMARACRPTAFDGSRGGHSFRNSTAASSVPMGFWESNSSYMQDLDTLNNKWFEQGVKTILVTSTSWPTFFGISSAAFMNENLEEKEKVATTTSLGTREALDTTATRLPMRRPWTRPTTRRMSHPMIMLDTMAMRTSTTMERIGLLRTTLEKGRLKRKSSHGTPANKLTRRRARRKIWRW